MGWNTFQGVCPARFAPPTGMPVSRLLLRLLALALVVAGCPYLWLRYQQRLRDRALGTALSRGDSATVERLVLKGVTLGGHPQRARAVLVLAASHLDEPRFLDAFLRGGGRLPSLNDRDWLRRPGEAEMTDWLRDHPAVGLAEPLGRSFRRLAASLEAVPVTGRSAGFYHLLGLCRYQAADYLDAAAAFDRALRQHAGSRELKHNLEMSRDAAWIARTVTPQLQRDLQLYARVHPEELIKDTPPGAPVVRVAQPDFGVLHVRRISPSRIIILSSGVVACGDFRQDIAPLPGLHVSLWAEERGKLRPLWASRPFEEMVSRDGDSNPDKIVDLRTVDLDADSVPEVVLTFIARSGFIGTNYADNTSVYVYRCAKEKLLMAGHLTGESKFNDPDWPWLADLHSDGLLELGVSTEAGLGVTAPVPWTDIYALKNGHLQVVNGEFPQRFHKPYEALNAKVANTPGDDEALVYRGRAEEILGRPRDAEHSYRKAREFISKDLAHEKDAELRSYYRQELASVNRQLAALYKAHPELPGDKASNGSRRH